MITSEKNKLVKQYILDAIDGEGYDLTFTTDKEKIAFLDKEFRASHQWLIDRVGYQRAMSEFIGGLPSYFDIAYTNSDIIDIAIKWGDLIEDSKESRRDMIVNNWFNYIAAKTTMLINKMLK